MLGKRLTLPLGAALLAGLAFGPGQVAQASTAQQAPAVVSTVQGMTSSTPNLVKAQPEPDRRRHHRHHREGRHHRHERERHHRYGHRHERHHREHMREGRREHMRHGHMRERHMG
ncbi:hypothetical protein [Planotetraspora kaengkrachanensis]|uniref:Uncharacterized protein n=1 Tax=Planotetraspora kaengkrachanensis TaxID=575193 RepID=A0A8J3PZX9_9ACTN|nr:hypothetical protein [Planotetraspora kaengkrachanensis]GIG84113.1 hypothetical protein Pka01_72400 [Planotetraspora kaengkrachanensis]